MFAIEVEWGADEWIYVVDPANTDQPAIYETFEAAQIDAVIWNPDHVRVTEYNG